MDENTPPDGNSPPRGTQGQKRSHDTSQTTDTALNSCVEVLSERKQGYSKGLEAILAMRKRLKNRESGSAESSGSSSEDPSPPRSPSI